MPEKRIIRISKRVAFVISVFLLSLGAVGVFLEGLIGDTSLESNGDMTLAGAAVALQMVSMLWLPMGAYLAVRAYVTANDKKKLYVVLILSALIYEPLYDLLEWRRGASVWKSSPLFSLCIALVMLYFYEKYKGQGIKSAVINAAVTVSGLIWCGMLFVSQGYIVILLCTLFSFLREKRTVMLFSSAALLSVCSAFEPLLLFSFLGVILVSFSQWDVET